MFFSHHQYYFNAHYYFTFSEPVGKKLLYRYLGLVCVKMIEQQLISVLHKTIIRFGLEFKAMFRDVFGNERRVD